MQIKVTAASIGRKKHQQSAQESPLSVIKTMKPGQLPQGDHRRGRHSRLKDLQYGRCRDQPIDGEHQN